MHSDRVVNRAHRAWQPRRGEIVKVLKRAHATVVGEFHIGRRGQYVKPHDERLQQWIDIPDGMEFPPAGPVVDRIGVTAPKVESLEELDGMIVNVELLEYAEKGAPPVGRVIEILGRPDDFGVDGDVIAHHLPSSAEVLVGAGHWGWSGSAAGSDHTGS
jgi:ribonuclease R